MSRCLFVVEDSFLIKDRLVLVPGLVSQGEERFRIGDSILLKRPDGSRLEWKIGGIEMILRAQPRSEIGVVFLFKDLSKEDVPIGTEIWSMGRS